MSFLPEYAAAVSGGFLCPPNVYAPASQQSAPVSTTTLAAFDSGVICTGSFIAPPSGSVIVRLSCVIQQSTGADEVLLGLAAVGTVTPVVGKTVLGQLAGATEGDITTVEFPVSGLTPGAACQFDLLGAAQSGTTVTILAQGLTATTIGTRGGPVVMSVQQV
jgi:hypothetical protein